MRITNLPSGPMGANSYLVVDEVNKKGFIIDAGGYNNLLVAMAKNEDIDLEYIILTHGHGDHIGGVPAYLLQFPNAKVVAAKDEVDMLADPDKNMTELTVGQAISVKVDIPVEDEQVLECGDMSLKFLMTPGHTDGGMCILTKKVVFTGDTLFCDSIGRTDFPGGSLDTLKKSIKEKLFTLEPDVQVFPGHMGSTSIGYEAQNNPYV